MQHHEYTLTGSAELGNVQLTVLHLSRPPAATLQLSQYLSPDEQERASRLRTPQLQERFRTGRGMLRLLLSRICNTAPDQLRFLTSAHGKPYLSDFPEVHFNVSHSGDLWTCAVSLRSALGLDVEQVRPLTDRDSIARRFFAPAEWAAIDRFPEPARLAAFYRCWTRKEAYLKALGDGLGRGLATFEVSCEEEELSDVHDIAGLEPWRIRTFVPEAGYLGALAIPLRTIEERWPTLETICM